MYSLKAVNSVKAVLLVACCRMCSSKYVNSLKDALIVAWCCRMHSLKAVNSLKAVLLVACCRVSNSKAAQVLAVKWDRVESTTLARNHAACRMNPS